MTTQIVDIPIESLVPHPLEPKSRMDPKRSPSLKDLAESIAADGVHVPAIVRSLNGLRSYQIVAGHRRWVGSKLAKLETLPCIVRDLDDEAAERLLIIENLQREDMPILDQVRQVERLLLHEGVTLKEAAAQIGRSVLWVHQRASLGRLIPACQKKRGPFRGPRRIIFFNLAD